MKMYRIKATLFFRVTSKRCQSTSIGFIGLGNMGAPMASNILKKYPDVFVYDINPDNVSKLVQQGAKAASNTVDIAKTCDIIITMVPATTHVEKILKGPTGIFSNARKGALLIDSSTIDPVASKAMILEARNLGLRMIDAPVSGGVKGAAAATLTFMVGGFIEDLSAAKDVLECMGTRIVHCGEGGSGGVTKLCNNLALAISMIGTSEAMALGVKLGMDPNVLAGVMNSSTARCWSSDSYNPVPGVMQGVPSARNYEGGFGTALMEKDLGLAMDAARGVKASLPLGSAAHQLYGLLTRHGYAALDFSVVYQYLSQSQEKKTNNS